MFIGFQGEITSFLLSPGTLRGHYGPCESPTTFQCQVVENETVAQTDRSLELPPVAPRGAWLRQKSCKEISCSRSVGIKDVCFV